MVIKCCACLKPQRSNNPVTITEQLLPALVTLFEARGQATTHLAVGAKLCTVERVWKGPNGKKPPEVCSPCCPPEALSFTKQVMVGCPVTRVFEGDDWVSLVDGTIHSLASTLAVLPG